ncbi:MAG TPA: lipase maturation factor family protein [Polyangiaceae bacterium]|nr:lipase maturation factor family protein [Polyangiaceae bacterium]
MAADSSDEAVFRPSPASHWLTRAVVLKGLGAIYVIAFAILVHQGPGLIGERGITPADGYVDRLVAGGVGFWDQPTIFRWLGASDAVLASAAWVGLIGAVAMALGVANALLALVLWVLYLSFVHVGQVWYGYGWEILLLEAGFLAVFYAPLTTISAWSPRSPPAPLVTWLFRWLLFRLMFGAGLIKLRGDPCWRELTCLMWHYETQPVPSPVSWLLHQAPPWFHTLGTLFNHAVELVVPFAIFAPRPWRTIAGILLIAFQVSLIVSGNLAFLNWLTVVVALACFDDEPLSRLVPGRWRMRLQERLALQERSALQERAAQCRGATPPWRARRGQLVAVALLASVVGVLSLNPVMNMLSPTQAMNRSYDPFHLVNTYGAFGSVGRERYEIVIEGTEAASPEGASWTEYELPCKPGDPRRRPCLITPYHLRLDWQAWFVPLGRADPRNHPWLYRLLGRLLEAERSVVALFDADPFAGRRPRWVRVQLYRYRFAVGPPAPSEGPVKGDAWWYRTLVRELVPPLSLEDFRDASGADMIP